jgi:hypothetical protein
MGYCEYFKCDIDSEELEQKQDEFGEHCLGMTCEECEWHED